MLPGLFLDRDLVAREKFRRAFYHNFKAETQEDSRGRGSDWSGGSGRMGSHFCPRKFSGAVFQVQRAGWTNPRTFICGPQCLESTSPLVCYCFVIRPLHQKVFRDGDVGHPGNLMYVGTRQMQIYTIKVRARKYVNNGSGYIHDKKINMRQPQEPQQFIQHITFPCCGKYLGREGEGVWKWL